MTGIKDGSWFGVSQADFGDKNHHQITFTVCGNGTGAARVSIDSPEGEVLAYVPLEATGDENEVTVLLEKIPGGVHDVFFTFAGSGYEIVSWRFVK